MKLQPRLVGLLSALALVPVGLYASGEQLLSSPEMAITALNVLLIVASLFLLFGPSPGDDHDHGSAPAQ